MKKLVFVLMGFAGLTVPLVAQIDHDYSANDFEPVVYSTITKDQVPAAVLKAVNTRFDKDTPQTWSKFPFTLKEYGWVYDVNSKANPVNDFQVIMKTKSGDNLWAVYDAQGNLVQTREVSKNVTVPAYVATALANSQYKDWTILSDKEIIQYYHSQGGNNVEEHLRLTVEKNNVKKSLSFNYKSNK
jgi:hypothetical protein